MAAKPKPSATLCNEDKIFQPIPWSSKLFWWKGCENNSTAECHVLIGPGKMGCWCDSKVQIPKNSKMPNKGGIADLKNSAVLICKAVGADLADFSAFSAIFSMIIFMCVLSSLAASTGSVAVFAELVFVASFVACNKSLLMLIALMLTSFCICHTQLGMTDNSND